MGFLALCGGGFLYLKPHEQKTAEYLNVYNWYGMIPKDILEEFEAETGISIRYDLYDNNEILEAKLKIKDYKVLLEEAMKTNNFDREIKLKKELETLENICISNEKEIDNMVYKLYDLTEEEIKIVESI